MILDLLKALQAKVAGGNFDLTGGSCRSLGWRCRVARGGPHLRKQ
jgi:hypothetical protein